MATGTDLRTKIVETALAIVGQQSISRLTLEEVARSAGISKGGLLYHFPNKQSLVQAMTSYVTELIAALCERHYARLPVGPNRRLKAYVLANFEITEPGRSTIGPTLLSAAVNNPELIGPMQRACDKLVERIRTESTDRDLVLLVDVAVDGLWLHNCFKLTSLNASDRRRLKNRMLAMIDAAARSAVRRRRAA